MDGGLPRLLLCGAPVFIHDDLILSCSDRGWGFTAPAPGTFGHSTSFSMLANAADL
jgi:hypothetical protein